MTKQNNCYMDRTAQKDGNKDSNNNFQQKDGDDNFEYY